MARTSRPTVAQLTRALALAEQIEQLRAELTALWGGRPDESPGPAGRKTRQMSPEARERIAAAQRRRWARQKND